MAKEVIKSTMFVVEIRRLVVLLPPPPLDGASGAALAVVDRYVARSFTVENDAFCYYRYILFIARLHTYKIPRRC